MNFSGNHRTRRDFAAPRKESARGRTANVHETQHFQGLEWLRDNSSRLMPLANIFIRQCPLERIAAHQRFPDEQGITLGIHLFELSTLTVFMRDCLSVHAACSLIQNKGVPP
ncbi:hypothetical protein G7048_19885 [Diaphorobacter sp. HDW4B]|uniref:hypothetical protein n=1 Tax=Diaphorobacter sp. HDW4B TaxID=2714925 RepID=UPI00140DD253|nr:hypothetical protein [Diaphorobacter sp. HDW4B]QIL72418.1 hypothetical protein G7048_19885 [Diaphorobacter sp. HDW4B]